MVQPRVPRKRTPYRNGSPMSVESPRGSRPPTPACPRRSRWARPAQSPDPGVCALAPDRLAHRIAPGGGVRRRAARASRRPCGGGERTAAGRGFRGDPRQRRRAAGRLRARVDRRIGVDRPGGQSALAHLLELRVADADAVPCAFATYAPEADRPLQCRGEWRCAPGTTPVRLLAQEHITEGAERCIDGCAVALDLARGVAIFDCSADGVSATARLQRTQ